MGTRPASPWVTRGTSWLRLIQTQQSLHLILLYYTVVNATLLCINKLAIHSLPAPTFILLIQLMFAAAAVKACMLVGMIPTERLGPGHLQKFIPMVMGFLGTLFSNIKVLQYANVETFITFRSSSPLVLSICDYLFLGRKLPALASVGCLLGMLLSCLGYALVDSTFSVRAYSWLAVWYVMSTAEACYFKNVCNTVHLAQWTRVLWTNWLSSLPLLVVMPLIPAERAALAAAVWNARLISILALSCIVGVGLSHATYLLRSNVSATTAAVVGVVCKLLTVFINLVMWDKHASPAGLACLLASMAFGSMYKQAPPRETKRMTDPSGGGTNGDTKAFDAEHALLLKADAAEKGGTAAEDEQPEVAPMAHATGAVQYDLPHRRGTVVTPVVSSGGGWGAAVGGPVSGSKQNLQVKTELL